MLARTPRDLGLMIREQRRKLGLGQRELAERVGVSRLAQLLPAGVLFPFRQLPESDGLGLAAQAN